MYQSQPEPEIYIYNENEFFESGYLKYIVTKSWWSNRLHRNQYINQRPNAVYLFVEVAVQNIDSQPRVIPPFRLVDENDAVYSTSSNSWVVENSIGIMETLNPNVSKRGIVVFDVPKDKKYALQLLGGYWSGEAVFVLLSPKSSQTIKRPDISLDVGEL